MGDSEREGTGPYGTDDDVDLNDPWVTAADDGFEIDVDAARRPPLVARLAAASAPLSTELVVEVIEDGEPRPLPRTEVERLIDEASAACLEIVSSSPTTIDEAQFEDLARGAGLLSTIWSLGFQADDPDGAERDRELAWLALIGKLAADCEDMFLTHLRRRPDDTFSLRWGFRDRAAVREAIETLRSLMSTDDPAVSRLFPSAYGQDAERNAGWDVLMRGELIERRLEALVIAEALMQRRSCTRDELDTFMRCVNDARLVFGTRLDVSEDDDPMERYREAARDPEVWKNRLAYERLTHLLGLTVEALDGTP